MSEPAAAKAKSKWSLRQALAWRPTRGHVVAAVAMMLAITSLSAGGYYLWLTTPPPMPRTAAEAVDLLTSPRYQRLPQDRRASYMEHSRSLWEKLSDEERRTLFRKVRDNPGTREAVRGAMVDQMLNQAREYATGTDFERQQLLDKVIGMQEMGRARWEKAQAERARRAKEGQASAPPPPPPPPPGGPPHDGPPPPSAADPAKTEAQRQAERDKQRAERQKWMQDQIERGDPQRQAYVAEFFKALRQRRVALGLPADPPMPPPRSGNRGSSERPAPTR